MKVRLMMDADLPQVIEIGSVVATAPHWPPAEFTRMLQVIAERPLRRGAWVAIGEPDAKPTAASDVHPSVDFQTGAPAKGGVEGAVGANEDGALLTSPMAGRERVVGFAMAAQVAGIAELEAVVTAPAYRRRGVGSALLREVIEWARGVGAERLVLEARSTNSAALSLYAQLGFVPDGIRRRYYRNPDEDAVLLSLRLGSESGQPLFC